MTKTTRGLTAFIVALGLVSGMGLVALAQTPAASIGPTFGGSGGTTFTGGAITSPLLLPDSTVGAPGLDTGGSGVNGLYSGTQQVNVTANGTGVLSMDANRGGIIVANNQVLGFSDNNTAGLGSLITGFTASTAQTPDSILYGVPAASNGLILAEYADRSFDFAHAQATNPTLFIHSAAQSTTQWIALSHDGASGVLKTGTGGVYGYKAVVTVNTGTLGLTNAVSQLVVTNTGDADGSTVNLPNDPDLGDVYVIVAVAAQNITLVPAAGETVMFGNTTCGTSYVIGGAATGIGDSVTVIAATGGSGAVWVTTASAGTPVCTP